MKRLSLVAALVLLAGARAFAQTDVAPKPDNGGAKKGPPPPIKVATVDLSKVYDGWTKVKDFTDGLEAQKKEQEAELQKMEKEIKEKVTIRDTPGINPKLKMGAQLEIVQLQAKADYMMKMWNEQVKRLLDEGIAKYFDEIQAEVAAYSKENGLTLVFKTESGKLGESQDPSRSDEKIARRMLLYWAEEFDITADVLARLEEKYKKEKAAAPKEGAGGNGGK